jgi:hypothetical protein
MPAITLMPYALMRVSGAPLPKAEISLSIAAAALYHGMSNLSWQLFPSRGSHCDPRVTTRLIVAVAAMVTLASGARTLRRQPA